MCNLLIVDDDPDIASVLCKASSELSKIECITAGIIAEAKNILSSRDIGILLLDIRLRGESGLDLARYVNYKYSDIIIVAFTGYPDVLHSRELLAYIDDFLYKPVSIKTLTDRMITWLIAYNHKKNINSTLARIRAEHEEELETAREVRQKVEAILGEMLHG